MQENTDTSVSADEESSDEELDYGILRVVPVFATVNIPIELLNKFLMAVKKYSTAITPVARILTAEDMSSLDTIQGSTKMPMKSFTSPFGGMTLAQINTIFSEQIYPQNHFTNATFVVLDQRSVADETCLVHGGGLLFEPDKETSWLRTDFHLSLLFVLGVEVGTQDLGEGLPRDVVYGEDNVCPESLP